MKLVKKYKLRSAAKTALEPYFHSIALIYQENRLKKGIWIDERSISEVLENQDTEVVLPEHRCRVSVRTAKSAPIHCVGFLYRYAALFANEEYDLLVQNLYLDLLNRPADPEGFGEHTKALQQGGSLENLVTGFLEAPEFEKAGFRFRNLPPVRWSLAEGGEFDTVFFSHERHPLSPFDRDITYAWGGAHYSYSIVAQRFIRMFEHQQKLIQELKFPEIYKEQISQAHLIDRVKPNGALHFIVKPIELVGLMPGIPNFMHYAWEFNTLSCSARSWDIRKNQVDRLKRLDGIFVPSSHIVNVLQDYGVQKVRLQPTPVVEDNSIGTPERTDSKSLEGIYGYVYDCGDTIRQVQLVDLLAAATQTILAVLTPSDHRKNIRELLHGFISADLNDTVLIVKLTVDQTFDLQGFIQAVFGQRGNSDNSDRIVFILERLNDDQLHGLFKFCDFYLSASRGEGQNLPILEAMAQGALPISPDHSAMADYISPENAVVIESVLTRAPVTSNYTYSPNHFFWGVSREVIKTALQKARSLSSEERVRLSQRSLEIVKSRYSVSACANLLTENIKSFS